jgi:Protein of unknown function (DUF1176)
MSHPCAPSFLVVLLGLASLMAVAHAQSPPVPAYRSFKDWVVGCDNTRSCIAVGLQPEDSTGHFVQVEREGGGQARVRVRFAFFNEELTPGEPIVVTVDGTPVPGMASSRPVHDRDEGIGPYSMILLDEGEVAPFLDAVRRGRRLRLAPASGEAAEVSLEGAVAALVFMDDAQGRVGTATALIRRGAKPESAVPAPPPPPRVRAFRVPQGAEADPGLVQIIRERLLQEEPDACDPPEPGRSEASTAPLGNDKMLVTILCTGGAYNFGYRHYIVEGGNAAGAKPAVFPVPEEAQEERQLFNSSFEPKTGLLRFFSKYRGPGDCGRRGEYAWTGERFLPVTYHKMGECRGVPEPYWPALWRAEVE